MWGTFALECAVRIVPENLSAHLSDVNSVHPEMTSSQLRVVHFTDARGAAITTTCTKHCDKTRGAV